MKRGLRSRFSVLVMTLALALVAAACATNGGDNSGTVDPAVERAKGLSEVQFYVTNQGEDTVSIVNIPGWAEVPYRIEVGSNPSDIVIASSLRRAYVANQDDGTVSFINTQELAVVETVEVGPRPHAMALSADNSLLFVPTLDDNNVVVVDTDAAEVIDVIELEEGALTTVALFDHDHEELYVLSRGTNTLNVIDPETFEVNRTFDLGEGTEPQRFAFSRDGSAVYVSLKAVNQVVVLDAQTGETVADPIATAEAPQGLSLSPNGRWLIIGNVDDNSVTIIDTDDLSEVTTVEHIGAPQQIHWNREGSRFYVVSATNNRLEVIEVDSWELADSISVGTQPHDIAIKAPRSGGSCG